MRSLLVAALALAVLAGSAQAHPRAARVALSGNSPLKIHGSAFHRREHVRIVVRRPSGATYAKRVTASSAGSFTASFAGDAIAPCGRYAVTATGSLGSRAQITGMKFPDCTAG